MAENKYKKAITDVKKEIKKITALLAEVDAAVLKTANTAKTNLGPAFKVSSPEGLTAAIKEQTNLMRLLSEQIQKQTTNTAVLNKKKKQLVNLSMQEKITTRESIKALKLQATANNNLIGAYTRLGAKQKIAKNNLRNLIAEEKKNIVQIKKAQREYDRLTKRVNQANKATSNFAKTGLGSMVRGFKNLIGAFGVAGGTLLFAGLIKNVFNLIKQIESLNFALVTVTKTQELFIRSQLFLQDITKRYGQDIISTTERYTKFLAAAQQSNIAVEETEKIFESVTKASAVLGLKTHELTGVYLALEQMLSKGKVTTEELRRQLGERLPGAMGIMADALDVSISQLDKMLKKGEVLSAEALPKFAVQLEKAYGIEAINTVDNLVNAQNRLANSWLNLVSSIEGSEGTISRVFKELFVVVETALDAITELNTTFGDKIDLGKYEGTKIAISQVKDEMEKSNIPIKEAAEKLLPKYNKMLTEWGEKVSEISKAQSQSAFTNLINMATGEFDEQEKTVKRAGVQIGKYTKGIEILKSIIETGKFPETISEIIPDEPGKEKLEAQFGSIGYWQARIKQMEDEQNKVAVNTDLWRGYAMAIKQVKENLSDLESEFDISLLSGEKVDTEGLLPTPDQAYASAEKVFKAITKAERERAERTKEINDGIEEHQAEKRRNRAQATQEELRQQHELFNTITAEFSEFFDIDISKFDFLFDGLKNSVADWADASKELIGSVLDASLERYEIELQEAQRARDLIINSDLASEKEKRIARQRFEREEREIKTRRAKAERTNALIQVAVDTASAIAKALAQTGVLAPAVIPTLLGIGLAQAALIAAQPLPKFAEGTDGPLQKDTLAWVGDAYRKEAITKDGKLLGISPDKPTLAHLPKGAEVHKDAHKYLSENEINNAVFKMNMASDGNALSEKIIDTALLSEVGKLRAEAKKTRIAVDKLGDRPVNINNKVTIEKEYEY